MVGRRLRSSVTDERMQRRLVAAYSTILSIHFFCLSLSTSEAVDSTRGGGRPLRSVRALARCRSPAGRASVERQCRWCPCYFEASLPHRRRRCRCRLAPPPSSSSSASASATASPRRAGHAAARPASRRHDDRQQQQINSLDYYAAHQRPRDPTK